MRLILRLAVLTVTALAVMFVIYPLMHEAGHLLAAVLTGAEVSDIGLFPVPFVRLKGQPSQVQALLTAFGASLFPMLCIAAPRREYYYVYCARLTVLTMWFFAGAESLIRVIMFLAGSDSPFDDAVAVLHYYPGAAAAVTALLLLQLAGAGAAIALSGPVRRTEAFFGTQTGQGSAVRYPLS